jgi:Prokaryotic N-terminal methylation motif
LTSPLRRRARGGFSLIELLVAMGIFIALGTSLVLILRGGMQTWRKSEARRETFEAAQGVMRQLQEDMGSMVAPYDTPIPGMPVDVRFLCDDDPDTGFQRLFLVRSIKGESQSTITGLAGSAIGAQGVLDYRGDLDEARYDDLRATGGLMEVAWILDDDGTLYRGVRSPIGEWGGQSPSLFSAQDPYELAPLPKDMSRPGLFNEDPGASSDTTLPALLRPYATEVIYLEYRFWSQSTTTWRTVDDQGREIPCWRWPEPDELSGPLIFWDSTRALLRLPDQDDPERFQLFRARTSLDDPRDDIFPLKVRVTIVFRERVAAGSTTFLTRAVDAGDDTLHVQDPGVLDPEGTGEPGYLLIGKEWIRFQSVGSDGTVEVARGGRGARQTFAADHTGEDPVERGRTFSTVLTVPCWREDWSEPVEPP